MWRSLTSSSWTISTQLRMWSVQGTKVFKGRNRNRVEIDNNAFSASGSVVGVEQVRGTKMESADHERTEWEMIENGWWR